MICPRCKGKGTEKDIDWLCGLFTCGISLLNDLSIEIPCKRCGGRGEVPQIYPDTEIRVKYE